MDRCRCALRRMGLAESNHGLHRQELSTSGQLKVSRLLSFLFDRRSQHALVQFLQPREFINPLVEREAA